LEEASFLFSEKLKCHPRNIFGDDAYILINKPKNVNNWQKTQNGKNIHHALLFIISTQQQNKWEVGCVILANILPPTNVVATLTSGSRLNVKCKGP
jgi:hypothetical protein